MTNRDYKDSIYEIEPWNEDSSTIPSQFLNSKAFAKTSFPAKNTALPHPMLQIATNSVYVIQNHHETEPKTQKIVNKYQKTAESSPKFTPKEPSKLHTKGSL